MSYYIHAQSLSKNFKSYKKEPGLKGAIKSIFSRNYQIKQAIADFNITVKRGEIIALLGPNGAGKTTLMKMFTGIIVPSSGILTIGGYQPHNRDMDFRQKIALVMGQKSQLWWDIPAMDSFLLLKSYYQIPSSKFKEKLKIMAKILQVEDLLHIHIRKLSLGERMKMELMASLIHDPEVIFLDEPTIGLDLLAQDNIRQFIHQYHQEHDVTIFLTSHYMADVQALCQRLVLIQEGKKTFDGPLSDFEKILGNEKRVSFIFKAPLTNQQKSFFKAWQSQWKQNNAQVDLTLREDQLCQVSADILKNFDVTHFYTDKIPIEYVMKNLLLNPKLNRQQS